MKKLCWLWMAFLTTTLVGCTYHRNPELNKDLTSETWQSQVDTNSNRWLKGTSRWFLNGDPHVAPYKDGSVASSAAISSMKVEIPDGAMRLEVDGDFQVQIFGTYDHNTLFVYGPNAGVRGVDIKIVGNKIKLTQTKDAPPSVCDVIIRIGLQSLSELNQFGAGRIEGRMVRSGGLSISQCGKGNIYLAGNMNLMNVDSNGSGAVTVIGASAPESKVNMMGSGSVNISGNIGLSSIKHSGSGEMNVIGLNSNCLSIYASGRGKIGLQGTANIKDIDARSRVRVYMYNVNSEDLHVMVRDAACVGLAGYTNHLDVQTSQASCFEGKHLLSNDAYVRASDNSHINARATNRMFATATGNASVYFYGPPRLMSQFVSGNGVVIPIFAPMPAYKDQPVNKSYKDKPAKVKLYKYR